jgi:hypothetical protein
MGIRLAFVFWVHENFTKSFDSSISGSKPLLVHLKLVGFDLLIDEERDMFGIFAALLINPVQTRFPVALPFGEFEIFTRMILEC